MSTYRRVAEDGTSSAFHITWDPSGDNPPPYEGTLDSVAFQRYIVSVWQNYQTCTLSVDGLTYAGLRALLASAGVTDTHRAAMALVEGIEKEST